MPQPAVKQRHERCKVKVLKNLLRVYNCVFPAQHPFHFHCYDKNGHKYIRIELDQLPDLIKEQIIEEKKKMPLNTFIQIHLFEKNAQDPYLIDI